MRVDRTTLVFVDASCLIAAAGSPGGGSGFILSLCARGLLRAAISQPVLMEAETNILAKLPPTALATYHRLLAETPLALASVPGVADRQIYRSVVGEKDDHVLAAALDMHAPFLLTLDQRLARRINNADLPVRAYAPGAFITGVLPAHQDLRPYGRDASLAARRRYARSSRNISSAGCAGEKSSSETQPS